MPQSTPSGDGPDPDDERAARALNANLTRLMAKAGLDEQALLQEAVRFAVAREADFLKFAALEAPNSKRQILPAWLAQMSVTAFALIMFIFGMALSILALVAERQWR